LENKNILIDIDGIIKSKNPKLYRRLPHFVVRWLENIIRQDKINRLLTLYGHKDGVDFIDAVFEDFNVDIVPHGLENIPKDLGKMVFVANHPLGGLDGLAVIATVNKNFGKAKGIVNDLLLNIVSLRSVFCGVNVYGHNTPEVSTRIHELYESSEHVCIFPAGLVSRRIEGKVQDLPWKKNFIEKAVKMGLPIVPIFVDALNSSFFYTVANVRKRIGIKFNYELVLLPSEVFKYHDKPIDLYFGKPVMPEELLKLSTPVERAAYMRDVTYLLSKKDKINKDNNNYNCKI
jgi:putative hemolysin